MSDHLQVASRQRRDVADPVGSSLSRSSPSRFQLNQIPFHFQGNGLASDVLTKILIFVYCCKFFFLFSVFILSLSLFVCYVLSHKTKFQIYTFPLLMKEKILDSHMDPRLKRQIETIFLKIISCDITPDNYIHRNH